MSVRLFLYFIDAVRIGTLKSVLMRIKSYGMSRGFDWYRVTDVWEDPMVCLAVSIGTELLTFGRILSHYKRGQAQRVPGC